MTPKEREQYLRDTLNNTFQPSYLDIINESHLHLGHAGAADGASHFAITIASEALENISRVKAHQKIYHAIEGMIPKEIHALRISLVNKKTPSPPPSNSSQTNGIVG